MPTLFNELSKRTKGRPETQHEEELRAIANEMWRKAKEKGKEVLDRLKDTGLPVGLDKKDERTLVLEEEAKKAKKVTRKERSS